MRHRVKPIQRLNADGRNQTETRYEKEILAPLSAAGLILDYKFEANQYPTGQVLQGIGAS